MRPAKELEQIWLANQRYDECVKELERLAAEGLAGQSADSATKMMLSLISSACRNEGSANWLEEPPELKSLTGMCSRIQVPNPGMMRLGMFVTTVFYGPEETRTVAPAPAVLHWLNRDWVYVPLAGKQFRRAEVVGGDMLSGGLEEILMGIWPGQTVVADALAFQNSV